jgi:hypothetical protein
MNRDIDLAFANVLRIMPLNGDVHSGYLRSLGSEQVAIIDQQYAELALFAASPDPTAREPGVVVVQGSVFGAVQTGDAARADVVVNIDSSNSDALRDAISALRQELRSQTVQGVPPYMDALLLDLQTEAEKPEPEPKRLVSLLGAASSVIGTIANAPTAWDGVRHAARALGLPLP